MREPIRVLIADDHAIVRRGVRGLLELVDDIEVVGEARNGPEAIDIALRARPDVVLMDLVMPALDGISATAEIRAVDPEIEVVALTSFVEEDKVVAALEAGAAGYLLKDADEHEVIEAIRAAHAGEMRLDPVVTRILADRLRQRARPGAPVEPLTDRELDVLGLLGRGLSNKEIATTLAIAESTTRTHVSSILGKLGVASRTQAALYAVEHDLTAAR